MFLKIQVQSLKKVPVAILFYLQLSLEEQVLWSTTNFLVNAVQRISPWATAEILQTLGAVVYENVDRLSEVC